MSRTMIIILQLKSPLLNLNAFAILFNGSPLTVRYRGNAITREGLEQQNSDPDFKVTEFKVVWTASDLSLVITIEGDICLPTHLALSLYSHVLWQYQL